MVEFGNEICSMSTNGLSWDHVRTFNPLSRFRAAGERAFSSFSLPPSLSLPLFVPLIFFSILALALLCVSCHPTLSYHATIEIKRIDRAYTEKEARRTGKTLSTARTYDLFRREAPTRNIRYP